MKIEDLQYPIGRFSPNDNYTQEEVASFIDQIQEVPHKIESAFRSLKTQNLDEPYRPGGWTVRQVLHHIPESHLNAYIRTKWALTEDTPLIKAYDEKRWAETPEIRFDPEVSVTLLKALHEKWVLLLRQLTNEDLQRSFIHPETGKLVRLDRMIHLYAWHGEHHLGHILLVARNQK